MSFFKNYELIGSGVCAQCQKPAINLLSYRFHQDLAPGICQVCAPFWPGAFSRNNEILRWHTQPNWEAARVLKQQLEQGRSPFLWLECENLQMLSAILQENSDKFDGTDTLMAFIHNPEEVNIDEFKGIDTFLDSAIGNSSELHIVAIGEAMEDERPFYNFQSAIKDASDEE